MSDLIEFILARIAEDEASGNEHRRREAQTRREVVLYCRQRLNTGEPGLEPYERALRQFASRYADHPDYSVDWRPDNSPRSDHRRATDPAR